MNDYKMNFSTKTLTITKKFAEEAAQLNSDASRTLQHFQTICPGLRIAYRTVNTYNRKPSRTKGLTYAKMENYIHVFDNSEELMSNYYKVRALSRSQRNPYMYVSDWFFSQFPDFEELPTIVNGKLYADPINVIQLEEFKSKDSTVEKVS